MAPYPLSIAVMATVFLVTSAAPPKADEACYGREYSTSHLAKHPQQLVTTMFLKIYDEPKYTPPMGWAMKVTRRGDKRPLYQVGLCRKPSPGEKFDLSCFVECDGGVAELKFTGTSLLLTLPREMSMRQDCGAVEDDAVLSPGIDDKVFRLDRVPMEACRGIDAP